MKRVLLVFASNEGQTAKIVDALARQIRTNGLPTEVVDLMQPVGSLELRDYAAVVVAASVHAGKHQPVALAFVREHHAELTERVTAMLSVSLSAASEKEAGQQIAQDQMQQFLRDVNWRPDRVEAVAGAFYYSQFSRVWRWLIRSGARIFRKDLARQGWPSLVADQEYTDWDVVDQIADQFCAQISDAN